MHFFTVFNLSVVCLFLIPQPMMSKCSSAGNGSLDPVPAGSHCDKCEQMGKEVEDYNSMTVRVQNALSNDGRRPLNVPAHIQNHKEGPSPTAFIWTRTHQRRWTVDFCEYGSSSLIIVKKPMKKPQPPQRSVSLLQPQPASHFSFKQHSCPSIEVVSPSPSSAMSFCPSPPYVPTSIITGSDPLGWKLRPKASSGLSRECTKRLSLQIFLSEVQTPSSPKPESSSKLKAAIRPKPSRRHHSEPTFLRSLGKALPVMAPEELCTVLLQPVTLSDEPDQVFDEVTQKQESGSAPLPKISPPVPEKTATARKLAHLIASTWQAR